MRACLSSAGAGDHGDRAGAAAQRRDRQGPRTGPPARLSAAGGSPRSCAWCPGNRCEDAHGNGQARRRAGRRSGGADPGGPPAAAAAPPGGDRGGRRRGRCRVRRRRCLWHRDRAAIPAAAERACAASGGPAAGRSPDTAQRRRHGADLDLSERHLAGAARHRPALPQLEAGPGRRRLPASHDPGRQMAGLRRGRRLSHPR